MAERSLDPEQGVAVLRRFPLSRYVRAFDASIGAVGYNSFHEAIQAGLPSIFVPNESPQQDDQLARARFAERRGLGYCVRTGEPYRLLETLDRLLDPDEQARIRATAQGFRRENGAVEAAQLLAELAMIRRGVHPPVGASDRRVRIASCPEAAAVEPVALVDTIREWSSIRRYASQERSVMPPAAEETARPRVSLALQGGAPTAPLLGRPRPPLGGRPHRGRGGAAPAPAP